MIELPNKIIKAESISPNRLLMYSPPKTGKTTSLSKLKNCLIVDLEKGSNYVDALKVKANDLKEVYEILKALKDKKEESGEVPYDFIALDTITELQQMVLPMAAHMYKSLPIGKNWQGDGNGNYDVRTLPNGAGYLYLRNAFEKVIKEFEPYCNHLILVGHLKDSLLNKKGKDVNSKDIDLIGSLKSITCKDADAIGYMHREDDKIYLNFETSDEITCGARPEHLKGQEILLSEKNEKGEVVYYWDKIFLELNKKSKK